MKVISMLNQKGGVGKSTLAICLGARWHLAGNKVALIDADPQRSVLHWSSVRVSGGSLNGIEVFEASTATDLEDVKCMVGYDYVLIDTPGTDKLVSRAAVSVSSAAVLPVKASAFDVSASSPSVALAQSMGVDAAFLITMLVSRSDIGQEAINALKEAKAKVVRQGMGNYLAYVRALGNGEVPQTMFAGTAAALNVEAIGQAVEDAFGWRN